MDNNGYRVRLNAVNWYGAALSTLTSSLENEAKDDCGLALGTYYITNVNSGLVLDATNKGTAEARWTRSSPGD